MDFDTWITWPFFLASIPFDGKGDEEFLLDERRESHVVFFFFFFSIEWKFLIYRNRTEALNFREPIFVTKREPYPGERYVSSAISFIKG